MKAVIFIHVLYIILIKTFMVKGVSKCESKVELRAVLISCPAKDTGCDDDDPLSQAIKSEESQILQADSKNFETLREEKEKGFSNIVKDCKRKLVITLKIKNVGKLPCDDEYIIVDHVFDPVTGGRGRLLSPVVLKLRQEQMNHLYGLQFQRVVNSDPFEEQKGDGQSCSVSPENPTCGITMYDGKPIPFSEGFCCSCDPHVNVKRQLSPTTRGDSLLYRDYKMLSQESPRFVREKKASIINPKLLRLKFKNANEVPEEKKGLDCGGLSDPLSWDRIPNYLLEHDRKVVCDRGDFMNELCKLQEDKYSVESVSGKKHRSKGADKGRKKKSGAIRSDVMEEIDLKKRDLTTVAVNVDANKENVLEDEQAHIILQDNFIKTLNIDQSTGAEILSDSYSSAKGSRGKRENRNENKKLTLEEKLERFVSSKSHLMNPGKRLLEVSHKRRRKADERCMGQHECQTVVVPRFLEDEYSKSIRNSPPKYFFSHDRYIVDPIESTHMLMNSSNEMSKEFPCEETKDKTCDTNGKNKKEEKLPPHSFYQKESKDENRPKVKEKFFLGKAANKKERVSHNEGGKIENSIGKMMQMRTENFEEPLKLPTYMTGDESFSVIKDVDESKVKVEEKKLQHEHKPSTEEHLKEPETNRINSKSFKSLFHKSDSDERLSKTKKIRNFFLAKNRERQKLRSDLVKGIKKTDENHKENEALKSKGLKDRHFNIADGVSEEKKSKKTDQINSMKSTLERQELEEDQISSKNLADVGEKFDSSSFPHDSLSDPFETEKDESKDSEIEKEEEKVSEEKNYLKPLSEKITNPNRLSNELKGDTDFSFEIIRQRIPEYTRPEYYSSLWKPLSSNQKNFGPTGYDTDASDPGEILNYPLKSRQNFLFNVPQKYFENEISPYNMYLVQNNKDYLKDLNNGQRYLKKPELELYSTSELNSRLQPDYNSYSQKKLSRHHRFSSPEYLEHNEELTKPGRIFVSVDGKKVRSAELRGKRYSERLRKYENGYPKINYPRLQKIRNKRSASYSFQPARGFFRSEFDSRNPEDRIVHDLEACLPESKARKSEKADSSTGRVLGWQFFRMKRENQSNEGLSSSLGPQNGFNCPVANSRQKAIKSAFDKQRLIQSYLNAPDYVLEEVEAAFKKKRQAGFTTKSNFSQQMEDKSAGDYSQDTAHCMRFGDMWYSMYSIRKPIVSQTVGIQLFDKHMLWDGTSQWRDLTKGKMIRVGTFLPKAEDDLPSIAVNFMGGKSEKGETAIDPDDYFLLIPSHVTDPSKANFYPQFEGGPGEYLLVHSKDVSSGGECNMIGTSFEAFARQPDRCNQRKGSCLKRQPVDLWREDMEARIRGKRGKYFVENFGTVPNSFVKSYTNLTGEFLALEYYGDYSSTIEIEVKADSNAIVRKGSNAQIPLVYVDSTYPKKTRIILSVLNIGLTSSYFRPRLGDCPPDLDPAWCPLEGPLVTIPPQQRHDFKLDLSGALPSRQIFVSVQVLNQVNKKIATRKICIKKGDRCVCAFHCKCSCIGNSADDRACRRLSLKDYRKAGYIGAFPFRGGTAPTGPESILKNIHIVFLTASYVLLLLGIMKGVLGIFIRRIGIAGVKVITGPRELCGYYESELQGCSVLYDEYGFPVHPTTCQPVQIVPLGLWFLCLSLPCCKAVCSEYETCSRQYEGDSDQKCSRPLLSKGISPTCVHYNLTTINPKKSKPDEYLPYPAYKGDDDPLEEDDTEFVLQEMKRYRKE